MLRYVKPRPSPGDGYREHVSVDVIDEELRRLAAPRRRERGQRMRTVHGVVHWVLHDAPTAVFVAILVTFFLCFILVPFLWLLYLLYNMIQTS